jgi:cytoskeletal protein RodZ
MKQEEIYNGKKRSRRRKERRGQNLLIRGVMFLFFFLLLVVLTAGGLFGYRYAQGDKTSSETLESSREVLPETMGQLP